MNDVIFVALILLDLVSEHSAASKIQAAVGPFCFS